MYTLYTIACRESDAESSSLGGEGGIEQMLKDIQDKIDEAT